MFYYSWDAFEEVEDYGERTVSIELWCLYDLCISTFVYIHCKRDERTIHCECWDLHITDNVLFSFHPLNNTTATTITTTKNSSGKKLRRFSHIRLVLREIDFPTKILEATSINQKRKWLERLAIAREDYEKARVEKEELEELERLAAEVAEKQRKEKEAESAK